MKLAPLLAFAALAGCTVGPNYRPPSTASLDVPASFVAPHPAGTDAAVDLAKWWHAFDDPMLVSLVDRALTQNLDIATAQSRLRQARLQVVATRAQGLPSLSAMGNVNYLRFSKNAGFSSLASLFGGGGSAGGGGSGGSGTGGGIGSNMGGVTTPGSSITTYSLGFDASWEVDIFGGRRRANEAALDQLEATLWSGRDTAVSLAAEVADDYLKLREIQESGRVLNDEIARQQNILKILNDTARAGLVPQDSGTQQLAAIKSSQAALIQIESQERTQIHAIAILLAQPPASLIPELTVPQTRPMPIPPVVPVGLPSDLLRRRPDIRAAERRLAGSTAQVGVQVAQLYPKFNLMGIPELISTSLGNLFTTDSIQATGTAAFSFPVFDFGRNRALVGEAREQAEQSYLLYRGTVLGALRDVEDALSQYRFERQRNATLREAVAVSQIALSSALSQNRAGLVDFSNVLNAEVTLLQTRSQVVASDATLREQIVMLYKALGGGWSEDPLPARTTNESAYTQKRR